MHIHRSTVGEVLDHALHEPAEAPVAEGFVVEDNQQRGHQIAHTLHVADVQVLPHVAAM